MLVITFLLCAGLAVQCSGYPTNEQEQQHSATATDSTRDDVVSRKVLGSSVVTSVSVIMDTGSEKHYSDAVGKPLAKPLTPAQVASPINLLNPDRYEFYTFSDSGDLVKRLMTLHEIQGIIANANGEAFNQNSHNPEKKVNAVVDRVQNVLKGEIEKVAFQNNGTGNIVLDTPDVSSSWSVILPAIFGNSGEEIKPVKPQTSMTPETIMLEHQTIPIIKKPEPFSKITTTEKITTFTPPSKKPIKTSTQKQNLKKPTTPKPSTSSTLKPPTTTRKPIKVSTTKKATKRTTPTTAIPRITTRGTRPNKRTTKTTTTTVKPELIEEPPAILERVNIRHTTASSLTSPSNSNTNLAEASSHFIQLFDPLQTVTKIPQTHFVSTRSTTTRAPILTTLSQLKPSSTISAGIHRPSSASPILIRPSEGALFIVDEKTNTRIPITTKEQLATILTKLEDTTSTSELFKNSSPRPSTSSIFTNTQGQGVPLITLNSLSGHQKPTQTIQNYDNKDKIPQNYHEDDNVATTSNIQSTTQKINQVTNSDDTKYQQLLLTSTNIYEINKELAKTRTPPVSTSISTPQPIQSTATPNDSNNNQKVSDMISTTIKEPNLVNSIEQLLQQAVGNIKETQKVTKIPTTPPGPTTTPEIQKTQEDFVSTTPVPSTTPIEDSDSSTITTQTDSVSFSDDAILNAAMGSLLSQVVSSDFQGLTTLQELPSTTEILNKPLQENLEYRIKTTDIFSETTDSTITTNSDFDKTTENKEIITSTENITPRETEESTEESSDIKTTSTNANEILKTDASTYNVEGTTKISDNTNSGVTETENSSETTVRDLPIVYDLGLHQTNEFESTSEESQTGTTNLENVTTEKLAEKEQEEQTLEKQIFTTSKPNLEDQTEQQLEDDKNQRNKESTISALDYSTTENLNSLQTTTLNYNFKPEDSDSLPSTNSYKEVTSNTVVNTTPERNENGNTNLDSTTSQNKNEETTLSIEELIKELVSKDENGQNVPKETTVLIITKPLYSTTPTTTTTTTTAPLLPTTESKNSTTPQENQETLESSTNFSDNTEAIAVDALASNTDSLENIEQVTTSSIPQTSSISPAKEPEWTIVSTIAPHTLNQTESQNKTTTQNSAQSLTPDIKIPQPSKPVDLIPMPQLSGLEGTTKHLDQDIYQFVALCNELAFGFWKSVTTGISSARSVVLSPFAATSLLAMVFLGARGATSGEMNEILRLDDMVTFNPHLIFKNVSESIEMSQTDGVATSVILRELYSDKAKGHLLNFYKERAKAFYDGHVEEVSFKEVGDIIRRRTNLIVKKQTNGKIGEFIKDSSITVKSPLAGVSACIFQTDCSDASMEGRDGELYFVVLPSIRQRRLVPVPAAVWRENFLAGYDPTLDATAVALGNKEQTISTIFVIPGQQGIAAPGDGLARLERHLIGGAFKDKSWSRLLMTLIPRPGLEVQIPRFQHRSVINATVALQQMGMKDLFDAAKADLRGLNGVANDLYLSDILQINSFATCGEEAISDTHHSEIYPATANRTYRRSRKFKDLLPAEGAYYDSELSEEPRDYQRAFHDPLHDPSLYALPLPLRPRQARLPDPPRLRFDRPFLFFVRHNPTGLILHMGRFNPRLLP